MEMTFMRVFLTAIMLGLSIAVLMQL